MRLGVLGIASSLVLVLTACRSDEDATPADDSGSSDDGSSDSSDDTTPSTSTTATSSTIGETTAEPTTDATTATTIEPSDTSDTSDTSDDTTATSDESSTDGESSDDESSSDDGTPVDPFPPSPSFGTNVLDLDLVGTWGLNWEPEGGFDSVIEIDASGDFEWLETSADCSTRDTATGHLWVEGMQVVMHVDTWERRLPWDTGPVLGQEFAPPFRLRMSFSLQGGGDDAYLTLAAPPRVTEAASYEGASYVRTASQGLYLGGTWRGEAELQAVLEGETEPVTIVRDVYEALLDVEANVAIAEGTGTRAATTTYFPTAQAFYDYDGGNWTCLDGCPSSSGVTLVDGSNLFTYGPYGGYDHLLTLIDGRTFRRDVGTDCE